MYFDYKLNVAFLNRNNMLTTTYDGKVILFETHGGIGVVWSEIRDEVDFDLFYQRFDLEGQIQFDTSGVTLLDGVWTGEPGPAHVADREPCRRSAPVGHAHRRSTLGRAAQDSR